MNKKDQHGRNRNRQKFYNNNSNQSQKKSSDIKSVSTNVSKDKQDNPVQGSSETTRQNQQKKINIFPKLKFFTQKDGSGRNKNEKSNSGNQKINKNPAANILNQPNTQNRDRKKVRVNRSFKPYLPPKFNTEICSICNKNINNMSNAIVNPEKTHYAHFECIMQELRKKYQPRANQRISYMGNSGFAIIEDVKEEGKQKFVIIQQLNYSL